MDLDDLIYLLEIAQNDFTKKLIIELFFEKQSKIFKFFPPKPDLKMHIISK